FKISTLAFEEKSLSNTANLRIHFVVNYIHFVVNCQVTRLLLPISK
ncbi:unnamed protein product, partial [marine sediment metagenome]